VFIDLLIFPYRQFPYFTFRDHVQLSGVLQKIAVCYLASFFIFLWAGWRGVLVGVVGINLLHIGLLYLYPVPGCGAGVLTPECSFPGFVNNRLMDGYTSGAVYDPDGLGSVLPAVSSVLFGVLAGGVFRLSPRHGKRIQVLLGSGLGLAVAGTMLSSWNPINKSLWTPSYAVFMAGLATSAFAAAYWLVDARQAGRWSKPLEILGLNAIACYLASRPVDHALRVHVAGVSLPEILQYSASPAMASLLFAVVILGVVYLGAWVMYRRRWFLKL
jgi:predicted acyltransferase